MTRGLDVALPPDWGERLRLAREEADITQFDAAAEIGVARTTLVAIEKQQRRIRIDELQKLARLYRTTTNALLRREAVHVDLTPRFRSGAKDGDPVIDEAASLLSSLVRAEAELENLLGVQRARNYPPERPPLPGDLRSQAEQDALEVRQWLGLGSAPVADIVRLLELQMGVRVYIRKLAATISGLYAYDDGVGAAILLNANHPRERRDQTAAHEVGHLVGSRRQPEVLHAGTAMNSRDERYADAFGRAFMAPARAVTQSFHEVTAGAQRLSRRHVIVLAHMFSVSREAMVRRLEDLSLARPGTWDWFDANGGDFRQSGARRSRTAAGRPRQSGCGTTAVASPKSLGLRSLAPRAFERRTVGASAAFGSCRTAYLA